MIEVTTKALVQIKIHQLKKLMTISNHYKVEEHLIKAMHLFIQNASRRFLPCELGRKTPLVKAI